MRRDLLGIGAISVGLTVLLARIDQDAQTFADIARLENVPAFVFYSAGFFGIIVFFRTLFRKRPRTE